MRYYSRDAEGNPTNYNPDYGEPTAFQLPASVRLGVEVGF
jgi:hypothetical protein